MIEFFAQPSEQVIPHGARNVVTMSGIDVLEEHHGPEHDHPVLAHDVQHPLPVELALGSMNYVDDVGPIESLTPGNKELGGDEFLGSEHARGDAKDGSGGTARNPGTIHGNDRVAHTRDEIDVELSTMSLGQPDRIGDFGL